MRLPLLVNRAASHGNIEDNTIEKMKRMSSKELEFLFAIFFEVARKMCSAVL